MNDDLHSGHNVSASATQVQYPASSSDWEEQRGHIVQLYTVEDRPLSFVMSEMKRLHSFQATERQYKKKINAWKIDKNVKDDEMRTIIRLQQRRKREGKASLFVVRDRPVDPKKIARFLQRKGSKGDDLSEGDLSGKSVDDDIPPQVRCYTPDLEGTEVGNKARDAPVTANKSRDNTTSCTKTQQDVEDNAAQLFSLIQDEIVRFQDADRLAPENAADAEQPRQDPWSIMFSKYDSFPYASQDHRSLQDTTPTSRVPVKILKTRRHGFDCGIVDSEISGHDDTRMILEDVNAAGEHHSREQLESACDGNDFRNRYYQDVVSVDISNSLLPLPEFLSLHPANLLYFHHFIENTARLLVGHDCCHNPFRTILPRLAISDDSLMNVLLAFSATHRAHILRHRSPSKRIESYLENAGYAVNGTFCRLACKSDLAKLGAHLLLVSMHLTCASPKKSVYTRQVPWHGHLRAARDLIDLRRHEPRDRDFAYLTRWFIGLESMKRSGGIRQEQPLILRLHDQDPWDSLASCYTVRQIRYDTHIDCLWGVSRRCLVGVTKVAQMAARATPNSNGDMTSEDDSSLKREALALRADLMSDVEKTAYIANCDSSPENEDICHESIATEKAYHLAALIHLNRQVLRLSPSHTHVRELVSKLFQLLRRFRQLKNTMLFPIVTAGFEAHRRQDQEIVLDCLKKLEINGFPTVGSLIPAPETA